MKVTDSFFLAFFPKSAQKACFLSQPFFPSLVERRMNRHFRDLFPPPRIDVAKRREKERGKIKRRKNSLFFWGENVVIASTPFYTLKYRSDTTGQQKWGIKTSFLRLPSSSFLSSIVVRNLIWPQRKGGKEREAGIAGHRPRPHKDGVLLCFFHQQKNFHNGRLANLILGRYTAVRDVRRPL